MNKSPVIATTLNDEGDEISLMGGASLGAPVTQESIVLMTPDGQGGRRAIPKMFDTYLVDTVDELPESPNDGDQAIIQKSKMITDGDSVIPSENIIPELFVAFEMILSTISGNAILTLSDCTFGTYTGILNIIFTEDAEAAEIGMTGPAIIIVKGPLDQASPDNVSEYYLKVSADMNWNPEEGLSVPIKTGWNLLTKTNDVWSDESITVDDIPSLINCVVGDVQDDGLQICSYEPWLYVPISCYAIGRTWYLNESVLPPFVYKFSEVDDAHFYLIAHTMNLYSSEMVKNRMMKPPGFAGKCALASSYMSLSNSVNCKIPSETAPESLAIKAALESALNNVISSTFGVTRITISLSDFTYDDVAHTWTGILTYTNDITGQVISESFARTYAVDYIH